MKSAEEIMQILDAYDLTGSLRDAGELADCSHHTVARYVAAREQGRLTAEAVRRAMLIDAFLPKLEEWVQRSRGQAARRHRPPQAGRLGLSGVDAHDPAGGGRGEGELAGRADPGAPAVAARAGDVGAVRLRRRPAGGGRADPAVLRLAGLVALPGGAADPGQDAAHGDRRGGHHAAPRRRGAHLPAHRQREDRHRRACGGHPGPPSARWWRWAGTTG